MSKKVLIVDDSESILEVVGFVLENAGFEVYKGIDGVDALNVIDENGIVDLIITDLHMPNMDGISFIKEVRAKEEFKFTPILFLTTESQAEKKMQAKEAGATGWIIKPFVPEKLLAAISKVLR
jgi:two-component system, chemotaxis family, chemotaxis protein CheY